MLAAQEIYKSVEDTILEYQEEIAIRERENDHLRRRLRDAGIEIWPDRPSMALLEDDDSEHPRREWSPSMGHEERIPVQIKDKREHRPNTEQPHSHTHNSHNQHSSHSSHSSHTSHSSSENLYPSQRADYPQEAPHSSSLQQGVENREHEAPSRNPVRKLEPNTNAAPQPLAPVNNNCSNSDNIDIIGESVVMKGGARAQSSHMRSTAASTNTDCPHQKSPIQPHMSSFCCKVCGEAFSHMGHLHVHVQVHTREKPYRCGVCGKCCSSSGRLQEHQRSHTGEKPFRCQICGKGFTQMAHLKVHMRIHTGEKPYSCPVCGKCFSRSDKIKRHLQTHNRDGQYFSGQ
uniref:C2H2-type domain-containing protein n=1 Tax=Knipowitschia caucasica TaxID=637954 RepID=A0AAV2M6G4_KNICA